MQISYNGKEIKPDLDWSGTVAGWLVNSLMAEFVQSEFRN